MPGLRNPQPRASTALSFAVANTGSPTGMPVAAAAPAVTPPQRAPRRPRSPEEEEVPASMKGCGKVERDTLRHSRPEKGNGVLRRCEKTGGLFELFRAQARLSCQGREIGRNLLPGGMNGSGEGPDRFRFFSRFRGKDHGVSSVQDLSLIHISEPTRPY